MRFVEFADAADPSIGTGVLNSYGVASYTTPSLAAGLHNITLVYGGDANNIRSTSAVLTQIIIATNSEALRFIPVTAHGISNAQPPNGPSGGRSIIA